MEAETSSEEEYSEAEESLDDFSPAEDAARCGASRSTGRSALAAMGFAEHAITAALSATGGDADEAVLLLICESEPPPPARARKKPAWDQLPQDVLEILGRWLAVHLGDPPKRKGPPPVFLHPLARHREANKVGKARLQTTLDKLYAIRACRQTCRTWRTIIQYARVTELALDGVHVSIGDPSAPAVVPQMWWPAQRPIYPIELRASLPPGGGPTTQKRAFCPICGPKTIHIYRGNVPCIATLSHGLRELHCHEQYMPDALDNEKWKARPERARLEERLLRSQHEDPMNWIANPNRARGSPDRIYVGPSSNADSELQEFLRCCGLRQWHKHIVEHTRIRTTPQLRAITAYELREMAKSANMKLEDSIVQSFLKAISLGYKHKPKRAWLELSKCYECASTIQNGALRYRCRLTGGCRQVYCRKCAHGDFETLDTRRSARRPLTVDEVLPAGFGAVFSQLRTLSMCDLRLDALPEPLRGASSLTELDVSGNLIETLASWVGTDLTALQSLDVSRSAPMELDNSTMDQRHSRVGANGGQYCLVAPLLIEGPLPTSLRTFRARHAGLTTFPCVAFKGPTGSSTPAAAAALTDLDLSGNCFIFELQHDAESRDEFFDALAAAAAADQVNVPDWAWNGDWLGIFRERIILLFETQLREIILLFETQLPNLRRLKLTGARTSRVAAAGVGGGVAAAAAGAGVHWAAPAHMGGILTTPPCPWAQYIKSRWNRWNRHEGCFNTSADEAAKIWVDHQSHLSQFETDIRQRQETLEMLASQLYLAEHQNHWLRRWAEADNHILVLDDGDDSDVY